MNQRLRNCAVFGLSTNVVEHPELIAERLTRFASCVGRENLIAGTDCGFAQEEINRRAHCDAHMSNVITIASSEGC